MLRAGAVVLTIWASVHLAISLSILAMVLLLGKNAPALLILYGDSSGNGIDARALATINYLAALCNGYRAALCLLTLTVIWCALVRLAAWAFWSVSACVVLIQIASFASGVLAQPGDWLGNAATSAVPLVGVILAAIGFREDRRAGTA